MFTQNKTFRKIWKGFWTPILSTGIFQWIIAAFMAICIWISYFTSRKVITNYETFKEYRRKPAIFVFWHGRSMMLSPIIAIGGMRAYAVASRHHDGRMMAKLQRLFGLRPIYGSTSDGGISVLRKVRLHMVRMTHWRHIFRYPKGPLFRRIIMRLARYMHFGLFMPLVRHKAV